MHARETSGRLSNVTSAIHRSSGSIPAWMFLGHGNLSATIRVRDIGMRLDIALSKAQTSEYMYLAKSDDLDLTRLTLLLKQM